MGHFVSQSSTDCSYAHQHLSLVKTTFDHSYNRALLPAPFILQTTINERQQAGGFFTEASTGNTGNGTSNNTFSYVDAKGNTFFRTVDAALNNIIFDQESGTLATGKRQVFPIIPKSETFNATVRLPGRRVIPN